MEPEDEDRRLRSVALQSVQSILHARQRAEQELLETKEALEGETRILDLLNRIGAVLASKLDLDGIARAVTAAGTDLSGAEYGAFFDTRSRPRGDPSSLHLRPGVPEGAFEAFEDARGIPLFAGVFRGEGVIRMDDATSDPRWSLVAGSRGVRPRTPLERSFLAVPVIAQSGEVVGALFFGHRTPAVFTERTERLIVGIAAHAAIAIDNARLYDEARRSADERARLLDAERTARAEVERVSMMKDEFLATLSHELRTPLNSVLGWSEILLSQATMDPQMRHGLETIARNARAQAKLIEDLLDMSRVVSGKIRLDVQRVDLATIIDAALDSIRPSADAKAIRVRRVLDPGAGPVVGDPNRLQQVIWNLLSNAVKFTAKDGKVDVEVRRVNSHVEISIRDTGIGIDPQFLPHLFQRFRQADSSITRRYGGLGLGLSIVRQLVELHGGTVDAASRGLGMGSTFTVCLPLPAVRELPAAPPREHPTTASATEVPSPDVSLEGITVLVVDDEPDAREIVKAVLGAARATVVTAGSAAEGLDLAKSSRPDVIVSDIGMPDRDGYDFMRDVRALPPAAGGKTPAIALTAFARTQDRTRALLAGYQVHVSKPIEARELVAAVRSLAGTADRSR